MRMVAKPLTHWHWFGPIIAVFCLMLFAFSAEAAVEVSLQELLADAQKYDGELIIFRGEAIGDILARRDFAWINVRDATGAVGVFCPKELTEKIEHLGSYKFSGDIISVRGIFNSACPQHGADSDIHAEKLIVLRPGEALSHQIDPQRVKVSVILSAGVFALAVIHLIVRRFR